MEMRSVLMGTIECSVSSTYLTQARFETLFGPMIAPSGAGNLLFECRSWRLQRR
jgi:hypothetical protein